MNDIERERRRSGKEAPAQIVNGLRATLGKDIPFTISQLSLEQVTREYRNEPTNPELLTQFMSAFWHEAGQRIGRSIVVDKFPLTAKEIKEKQEKDCVATYVPDGINRVDLGRMFPKIRNWAAVQEADSVVDVTNNSGWLWIESLVDAPNRNTTQGQLEETFKKERKQGQSLRSYIVGSQISKLLTDKYFDEGSTWSRLLGSCRGGRVLGSYFDSVGYLVVYPFLNPEARSEDLGGRFEEVIKA